MTDILRQPPVDVTAEQNVIGALLLDPARVHDVADWLAPADFYRAEHRLIFAAVLSLVRRNVPVDAVTVGDALAANGAEISPAYVTELASNTASSANVVAYAEIVMRHAKLRRAIEIGTHLTASAFDASADPGIVAADAVRDLGDIARVSRSGPQSARHALKALFTEMSEAYANPSALRGLPTPWRDINSWTGGLQDGQLYVIAARPSMGKSIMAGQIATFTALRGSRVLWFTVEMSAKQCMARAVSCIADIPYAWIKNPHKDDEDSETYWGAVAAATERLTATGLLIDETPSLTVAQLSARVRRANLRSALRLVVVDHLHEMAVDVQRARFEYGAITQACKSLAKECGCPVILVAQLNRALGARADKRPVLTDLRESGAIEEKADAVLLLHRDDYYSPNDRPGVVTVIPAKGRDLAKPSEIHLRNRFDRMRLEDWDGPLPARNDPIESAASATRKRWSGVGRFAEEAA